MPTGFNVRFNHDHPTRLERGEPKTYCRPQTFQGETSSFYKTPIYQRAWLFCFASAMA